MTAALATATTDFPTIPSSPVRASHHGHTARAEWTKLRTLRSTWLTVGGAVLASVGLAALVFVATAGELEKMSAQERLEFDPTSTALIGVLFASVILGCLAVRTIAAEYSSGMIRVTFSAIPGRTSVLAAKGVIIAGLAFPVALVTNLASFVLGRQILSGKHIDMSFSDPGVMQAIVLGAVAVSLVTLIGLGLGGIIRHTAGATSVLMAAIIGSQLFGLALPESARQYLPGNALQSVVSVKPIGGLLGPVAGLVVLVAYAVACMGAAAVLMARRDA